MGDDPKTNLLEAAVALLAETDNPASITVRQIAERAGAATGAVNYHFGSKDALLNDAIGAVMQVEADAWAGAEDLPPVARIKHLLKEASRVGMRMPKLMQMAVRHALTEGDFSVALQLVPMLRKHYGDRRTEQELRLLALALVTPLQVIAVKPEAAHLYAGIDPTDEASRDRGIDQMVDLILRED